MPVLHRPETLDEACALLAECDHGMVYGGGTAVQILSKQGVLFASDLVDISRIPGLSGIKETADGLRIGAMTPLRAVETGSAARRVAPLAARVYGHVANPRVRNTASVGGNLAHGDYRLDPPTALLVLDAVVELTGPSGARRVPVREFFVGFQETAVRPGEIVTAVEVPAQPEAAGAGFTKLSSLSANDWPCASAAALVDGRARGLGRRGPAHLRLGLGAVASTPVFTEVELPGDATADDAAEAARTAVEPLIDPIPDVRGGVEYKTRLAFVAVDEAVRSAWKERSDERGFLSGRRRGR
ncbi:molybdopterin dehydrogenase [Streptomyces sp. HNM0575]|uniref:FAD binding domain-containing protein n=1 Tax=Streptomyces sp. HNM0575 TaxID=2716338 RepID=UPI00145F934A|nr:FAD binding domain-containing protein [Streptomyces sp. HNM0575]NLU74998.1 molybdopterin dehydrogenase [Streptomyces sp. HNM0575]